MTCCVLIRKKPWLAVLLLPTIWAAILLLMRLWFELSGTLHDDVHIYMTVGRGILSGLTPYVDLFESKPPGMFLLSAASITLFGNHMLIKVLTGVAVLITPLSTMVLMWRVVRDKSEMLRFITMVIAFVFASVMTLYGFREGGQGLIEPMGTAAVMLFAVVYTSKHPKQWLRTIFSVLLMLFAIGIKEPFLFVFLAIALLLKQNWKHFLHGFAIPLIITGIVGLMAMAMLGYSEPYFTVYLKHMSGYHLDQLVQMNGSFPMRGLLIHKTLYRMTDFSPPLGIFFVLTLFLFLLLTLYRSIKHRSPDVLVYLGSLYLILLAIGAGGDFFSHHFVFGISGWMILLVLLVQSIANREWFFSSQKIFLGSAVIAGALMLSTLPWHKHFGYRETLTNWNARYETLRATAATIDRVMDQCEWDRYLHITNKGGGVFGFTEHSPHGPIFIQFNRFMDANPLYRERFKEDFTKTPIIVMKKDHPTNLTDTAKVYVNENFGFTPHPCALPFEQPEMYQILFRKK